VAGIVVAAILPAGVSLAAGAAQVLGTGYSLEGFPTRPR